MTRIFVDADLQTGARVTLDEVAARHLATVLRLREGAPLRAFNGRGGEYAAAVARLSKRAVEIDILSFDSIERESPIEITLAQGLARGDRMDFTIQKAVELGVTRIVPVACTRSNVSLTDARAAKRLTHWRSVIRHACEQCGRNRLPHIDGPMSLAEAVRADNDVLGLVLNPLGKQAFDSIAERPEHVTLLVGPEGGLDSDELATAHNAGFIDLRVGPRTLRTETAAIVGLALVQAQFGDL